MTTRTLGALALAMGIACSAPAMAACTDAQAEAKMTELANLMAPLMMSNVVLTETISTEMQVLIVQPVSDRTCASYDRLIARVRSGR